MGLFFTLLYILTAYLTPETIMGSLAAYHVEIVVAGFTLIASLFNSTKPSVFKMPQIYALMGLAVACFLSVALNGWIGGGKDALLQFLPALFAFVFIVLNCRTKTHLQMVVLTLFAVCAFVICRGYYDLLSGYTDSPFLIAQGTENGPQIFRLRGLGFINDPNDFSQLLVSLIPCLFFLWRPKRTVLNVVCVLAPTALLIFGMFLTHSRGALVALLAVIVVTVRRKIGTVPSVVIAAVLFAGGTAVGWSGGRDVSVEAGADRMEAWSTGLQLIKSHPVFGVGFLNFSDYYEITAHNTVVVCAAELGIFGFFFWVLFIYDTLWEVIAIGDPSMQQGDEIEVAAPAYLGRVRVRTWAIEALRRNAPIAQPVSPAIAGTAAVLGRGGGVSRLGEGGGPGGLGDLDSEENGNGEEDIRRLARTMVIALSGFLVAGWFLSRAYQMSLFVYGGMAEVVYQLALQQGIAPARMRVAKLVRGTWVGVVGLLALVYIMLRVEHLMPH